MKRSDQINELASALSKFQGQIQNAEKDSDNPYFKSSYSSLAAGWNVARKPLSDNGLSIVQDATVDWEKTSVTVTSLLMHVSGQWIESCITFLPKDLAPQSIGSCYAYGRRYMFFGQLGIASEDDDDAEGATDHKNPPQKKEYKPDIKFAPGEEGKKDDGPKGYFSQIRGWANKATCPDAEKLRVIAAAKNVKDDEGALKMIFDSQCK